MMRRRVGPAVLALALLLAGRAVAYVPPAGRIATAVVDQNREDDRATALRLQVVVLSGGVAVGQGELLSDPHGFARVELHHESGFVERHLLLGAQRLASRDGQPLADARPLLPPFPLLQASSAGQLLAGLTALGVQTQTVELGYEGDHDCYVIGGRSGGPALWVDEDSLEPVRMDLAGGVHYFFGPNRQDGGVRVPAWVQIEQEGAGPLRLEVRSVQATSISTDAFDESWLEQR
jgi:hypothetical protein